MSSIGSPYDEVSSTQATINKIEDFLYEHDRDEKLKELGRFYCNRCGETPLLTDTKHKEQCGNIKCKNPYCKDTLYHSQQIKRKYCGDCQKRRCAFCNSLNCIEAIVENEDGEWYKPVTRSITLCSDCGKLTIQIPKKKKRRAKQK